MKKEKKLTKKQLKRKEKRERNKKDKEWSLAIRVRDKCCVICGDKTQLNAHHIIPRENKDSRWLLENGVTLCVGCHKFRLNSAHRNPFWFFNQIKDRITKLENKVDEELK